MNRLAVAAILALIVHGALFRAEIPWIRPVPPLRQSRRVDINLQTIELPVEKPGPVKPKGAEPRLQPKKVELRHPPKPHRPRKSDAQPPVPRQTAVRKVRLMPLTPPPSRPLEAPSSQTPAAVKGNTAETVTADPAESSGAASATPPAVKVSVPLYDLNPLPVYPKVARRRNYQGTVLLDVRVTAEGQAAEVKVARSSGYAVLDQRALSTVRHWRFEPARRGTRAFETWVQVPVTFRLE